MLCVAWSAHEQAQQTHVASNLQCLSIELDSSALPTRFLCICTSLLLNPRRSRGHLTCVRCGECGRVSLATRTCAAPNLDLCWLAQIKSGQLCTLSILTCLVDQRPNLSTQRAEVMDPLSQPLSLMFDSSANSHSMALNQSARAARYQSAPNTAAITGAIRPNTVACDSLS